MQEECGNDRLALALAVASRAAKLLTIPSPVSCRSLVLEFAISVDRKAW